MPRQFYYNIGVGEVDVKPLYVGEESCRDGAFANMAEDITTALLPPTDEQGRHYYVLADRIKLLREYRNAYAWTYFMFHRPHTMAANRGDIGTRFLNIMGTAQWFMPSGQFSTTTRRPWTDDYPDYAGRGNPIDAYCARSTLDDFAHAFYTAVLVARLCYTVAYDEGENLLSLIERSRGSSSSNYYSASDRNALLKYYRELYTKRYRMSDTVAIAYRLGIMQTRWSHEDTTDRITYA